MHKLHYAVTKEIDDIVCHGITTSNLEILGELVDILKDIEQIWHWRGEYELEETTHSSENISGVSSSIDELIYEIKSLDERLKSGNFQDEQSKIKEKSNMLYEYAERIKHCAESVKLDADTTMKFKNMYK